MLITNSPDIGTLEVAVSIDLTGTNPVINLTNQTTANPNVSPVPNLNVLEWVLNIYSPTGTPIFQSDFTAPWKASGSGDWTTASITDPWPRPFGSIEWSGANYRIEFQVKDSAGTIYDLFKSARICHPAGNIQTPDTYGHIKLDVQVLCERSSLYFRDSTSKVYNGVTGINQSSYLAVDYPRDPSGTLPPPYVLTTFVTDALVPFTQNGEHTATYYSTWLYDLGDNVFVLLRYVAQESFKVQCNIDLCPIACEVKALEDSIATGSCGNVAEAQRKLDAITPKLLRAFIAKAYPNCGIDLPALVEEIKQIGGFTCECGGGASSGIGSSTPAIGPFVFSVNNEGGDVVASFEVTDGNVVLNIKDKSYTFGQCETTGTQAAKLKSSVSGTNVAVCLDINIADFAADIYATTAASTYLLNLFNSLVASQGGCQLQVDGKCIINSGACDYEFTLAGIEDTPNSSFLVSILSSVDANSRLWLNYAFNLSTLTALQTYLNTLGIGTFTVTDLGSGNVKIACSSNTYSLTGLVYTPSSEDAKKMAVFTSDCSGFVALSCSQIVQAIIDYLCGLDDSQVVTSTAYTICYVDPLTLTKKLSVVAAGSSLLTFLTELLARGCNTVDFIMRLGKISCGAIQELFPASALVMQANDKILGTKQGECAGISPIELGLKILQLGSTNPDFMKAWCALQQQCGSGLICEPYSVLDVSAVENSPADDKMDIFITFSHPSAVSHNLRYARIDTGDPVWTTITGILPGASPYTIANVDDGQYQIEMTPVYADGRLCLPTTKSTPVCSGITSFSAVFSGGNIDVSYSATSPKVRVKIAYPNGGTFSQIYTTGDPISIMPPEGVVGFYTITIEPVCNETTGWIGAPSAPVVLEVTASNNSTITNNSSLTLSLMTAAGTNVEGSNLLLAPTTLAPTDVADFNVPDGFYTNISLTCLSGSLGWTAYLVTGSGTYPLVANQFNSVTVDGGIQIVLLDTSP